MVHPRFDIREHEVDNLDATSWQAREQFVRFVMLVQHTVTGVWCTAFHVLLLCPTLSRKS